MQKSISVATLRCGCSKAEGFAGDAADVSHEQMQAEERHWRSLVPSTVEVFDRLEQSIKRCSETEDLNGDELVEWCMLSKMVNACDVPDIFSTARFTSHAILFETSSRSRCGSDICQTE